MNRFEKYPTDREYEQWLKDCSNKSIVEGDINTFERQIEDLKRLINKAREVLK